MTEKYSRLSVDTLNRIRRINEVRFADDGNGIIWSESTDQGGRIFYKSLNGKERVVSGGYDVRGTVGYGGGDFDTLQNRVIFSDRSGALIAVDLNQPRLIKRITPAWGSTASPAISPNGAWVVYVFSAEGQDGLAIARTIGSSWPQQLALGADFYMQPVWHPQGDLIAWTEWDHPDMPWDASRVKLGEVGGMQLKLFGEKWIAGGKGTAASQPQFSPDGKYLSFIIQNGEWDDLVLFNIKRKSKRTLIHGSGFHLRTPEWIQGMRSYIWSSDSTRILYFRYSGGQTTLHEIAIGKAKSHEIAINPYLWAAQLDIDKTGNRISFIGSAPDSPKKIIILEDAKIKNLIPPKNKLPGRVKPPQVIRFITSVKGQGYGYYFAPTDTKDDIAQKPPVIVQIHGGPTSASTLSFNQDVAFYTSHGYGFAQINYRGSSGYGYSYQNALAHAWGIADVEDVIAFSQELIRQGIADKNRLIVMGSSAGGFTLLNTLIKTPTLFKAAVCSYAVSDLLEDARSTHKFEKYYHLYLTGDPVKNHKRFIQRSPLTNIAKIKTPIALFHGDQDKVVSVQQSISIFEKLKAHAIPTELTVYPGEGHGFRSTENIADFYEKSLKFFDEHLKNSSGLYPELTSF